MNEELNILGEISDYLSYNGDESEPIIPDLRILGVDPNGPLLGKEEFQRLLQDSKTREDWKINDPVDLDPDYDESDENWMDPLEIFLGDILRIESENFGSEDLIEALEELKGLFVDIKGEITEIVALFTQFLQAQAAQAGAAPASQDTELSTMLLDDSPQSSGTARAVDQGSTTQVIEFEDESSDDGDSLSGNLFSGPGLAADQGSTVRSAANTDTVSASASASGTRQQLEFSGDATAAGGGGGGGGGGDMDPEVSSITENLGDGTVATLKKGRPSPVQGADRAGPPTPTKLASLPEPGRKSAESKSMNVDQGGGSKRKTNKKSNKTNNKRKTKRKNRKTKRKPNKTKKKRKSKRKSKSRRN